MRDAKRIKFDATHKFVTSSTLSAAPTEVPRLTAPTAMTVEVLHRVLGEHVIVIRNALGGGRANELAREVTRLTHPFPSPGEGTTGGRGLVSFPMGLTTLLHAETRMVLRGAAEHLRSAGSAASAAELGAMADQQPYTSVCGALLYDAGACLKVHLDDIAACNTNPYDARDVLWNFGNDCEFKWQPATTKQRWAWVTREYERVGDKKDEQKVTLRHGDALLLNVEKILHGVKVRDTCADAEARRLLGDRRICVPVRPKASDAEARQHATDRAGLKPRPKG